MNHVGYNPIFQEGRGAGAGAGGGGVARQVAGGGREVAGGGRGWSRSNKPKAYTRGWRDEYGGMNINVKVKSDWSKSGWTSSTTMIHPNHKVSRLITDAKRFVTMGDHNGKELEVHFRKHNLELARDELVGDLFEGNESIYIKEID